MTARPQDCHDDHVAVKFSGELIWKSAIALVDRVHCLARSSFYKTVEFIIHSEDGRAGALDSLHRAFSRWRNHEQMLLRTRAIASAASATAVLLSIGDERIAEPEAQLLYHFSRVLNPSVGPAQMRTRLNGELAHIDKRIIGYSARSSSRRRPKPSGCGRLARRSGSKTSSARAATAEYPS